MIDRVLAAIAATYSVSPDHITRHQFWTAASRPRMALVFVLREVLGMRWRDIGEAVGLADPAQAYRACLKRRSAKDRLMIAACWAGEQAARESVRAA